MASFSCELGQDSEIQNDLPHMSETLVLATRWGAVAFVHVTSLTLSPYGLFSFSRLA